MKKFLLVAALLLYSAAPFAAEFDVDAGATLLRRLQLCVDCGSALLVTRVQPGVIVRCPDCGREQARLRDQYLITQLYQLCRLCQAPLDSAGRHPGDAVECANCHTRQTLTRDAFLSPGEEGGLGYLPGYPPGSGPKRLLFDSGAGNALAAAGLPIQPDLPPGIPKPDGPAANIPLTDLEPGAPPVAARPYLPEALPPRPPPAIPPEAAAAPMPPLANLEPQSETTAALAAGGAVDVPAVNVEMFGGAGKNRTAQSVGGGDILAKVNGEAIRRESVDVIVGPVVAALNARPGQGDGRDPAERERELRASILDRLIDRALTAEEAERVGFRPDPAALRKKTAELTPRLAGTTLKPEREAYLELAMEAMRKRIGEAAETVSPEAMRDYYQAHKDEMLQPARMAVATLTVFKDRTGRVDARDYRAIAQEIAAGLEKGERFDELRARHDEFPPAPGETPPLLPESYYSEEIRALAGTFRTGAVFGPVFPPGMVLFGKITEKRPPEPLPFAEVEKDIRRRLAAEEEEKLFARWLEGARKRAAVEIFAK